MKQTVKDNKVVVYSKVRAALLALRECAQAQREDWCGHVPAAECVHQSPVGASKFTYTSTQATLSLAAAPPDRRPSLPPPSRRQTHCPYCSQVKGLLGELKVPAKVIELDQMGEPHDQGRGV